MNSVPGFLKAISYPALAAAVTLQFGCSPKASDVVKKYEGAFRTKRADLLEIAQSLPPEGSLQDEKPCPDLAPALLFDEHSDQSNTEILTFGQLKNPNARPVSYLLCGGALLRAMDWTDPKTVMSSSADSVFVEKQLRTAAACRYLVVNRVVQLVKPIAADEKSYSPGRATIEVFVVDLPSKAALCSFVVEAASAANVTYYYRSDESKRRPLEEFALSSLWEDARKKIFEGLKRVARADIKT